MHAQHIVGAVRLVEDGLERLEAAVVLALWLQLVQLVQLVQGERLARQSAGLQSPTVEPRAVVIESLADHLAALDDNAAVAVVQRRELSLLEAQVEVSVSLHCDLMVGEVWGHWIGSCAL